MKLKRWLTAPVAVLLLGGGALAAVAGPAHAATPIFTGDCAAGAGSGTTGCGGVDDGTTTAPEPGFLPDETPGASLIHTEQDAWNASHGDQQMTVNSYHDWSVTATDGPQSTAEIQTYPENGWEYFNSTNPARYNISTLTSITSTYNQTMPPVSTNYTAEAAYDIWMNNWATEVMIWTNVHYQNVDCGGPGWTPQCSGVPQVGTFTFNGQQWTLYGSGGFWMWEPENGQAKDAVQEPNGSTIDVLDMLKQTAASGAMAASSTITALEYGWEIANTNGVPLTFTMNDVQVSVNGGCCTAGGGTGQQAPAATTSAATNVTSSGATLNGTVNPQGAATTYQFDYGPTASYGSVTPAGGASAGSGTTAVNESAALSGLAPGTTEHYRVEATNSAGTTFGADQQFTTSAAPVAPVVTTTAATGVTSSGATLNGTVNPEGQAATYQFEYGPTTAYGTTSPATPGSAGSGSTAVNESSAVTGLSASTTYHYRLNATNATGTTHGSDGTFTTSASGGTSVAFDASAGAKNAGASPLTWTQVVGSGANREMLVDFTIGSNSDAGCAATVTDNGNAMTQVTAVHSNNQRNGVMTVYALKNPPSGTNTISASVKSCTQAPSALTGGSMSFTGVNQTTPLGAHAIGTGSGAQSTVTNTSSSTGDMEASFAASGSGVTSAVSPTVSKFLENQNFNSGAGNTGGGYMPASGGSDISKWNLTSDWWGGAMVDLNRA